MKKAAPGTAEGGQAAVVVEDRAGRRHLMTEKALCEAIEELERMLAGERMADLNGMRRCLERLRGAVESGADLGEAIACANEWQPPWTDLLEAWRKALEEGD